MGVLAEYVKKEAEHLQARLDRQKEAAGEWFDAIERLYRTLSEWVTVADSDSGLLRAERKPGDIIQEPRLGVYTLDKLVVSLGGRKCAIVPRARYVVAAIKPPNREARQADGTVTLKSEGGTVEYYLFRLKDVDQDRWFIQSDTRWHADPLNNDVEELNSDRFEAALLRVLQ